MPDWPDLMQRHGPLVWNAVYRLVGNEADAADCFQETFLRAFQTTRRVKVRNWAGLLHRIAVHASLDRLRHRIRTRSLLEAQTGWDILEGNESDPAQRAADEELQVRLRSALAQLPEAQATVFVLSQLCDMSYEDVAEVTGREASHVGVLLHRARRRLAEILNPSFRHERGCTHAHRD